MWPVEQLQHFIETHRIGSVGLAMGFVVSFMRLAVIKRRPMNERILGIAPDLVIVAVTILFVAIVDPLSRLRQIGTADDLFATFIANGIALAVLCLIVAWIADFLAGNGDWQSLRTGARARWVLLVMIEVGAAMYAGALAWKLS